MRLRFAHGSCLHIADEEGVGPQRNPAGRPRGTLMAILVSENGDGHQIRLEGAVDIGAAAELKTALVDALGSGMSVTVSLEALSDLDVTVVQLLWAARRDAEGSGAPFTIRGPLGEGVRQTLASLGLGDLLVAEPLEAGSPA